LFKVIDGVVEKLSQKSNSLMPRLFFRRDSPQRAKKAIFEKII
jgi:hypothetical protein